MSNVVIDLIDSVEYVKNNCFAHQLHDALQEWPNVITLELSQLHRIKSLNPIRVISRLKQRTLFKNVDAVSKAIGDVPVVVYDQDPWQAFMNDSPYVGAYDLFCDRLNVKFFALTTKHWVDYLSRKSYPTKFVNMWVKRQYCIDHVTSHRNIERGFVGQLHPYRRDMNERLATLGFPVSIVGGNTNYVKFLHSLRDIKFYIHNEQRALQCGSDTLDLRDGLWIKDIEAISQGCISIRNRGLGYESYFLDKIQTLYLYDDVSDIPDILDTVEKIEKEELLNKQTAALNIIYESPGWQETATTLVLS